MGLGKDSGVQLQFGQQRIFIIVYVCACVYVFVHMYTSVCTSLYMCIYLCVCVCVCGRGLVGKKFTESRVGKAGL